MSGEGGKIVFENLPKKMSPNDPLPILRPSLYLLPTRSSMVWFEEEATRRTGGVSLTGLTDELGTRCKER